MGKTPHRAGHGSSVRSSSKPNAAPPTKPNPKSKSKPNTTKFKSKPKPPKPVKPPTDPTLATLREKTILPVLKQLQSHDINLRGSAASTIANLATDEACRKLLLRERIVDVVLGEILRDERLEGRGSGWRVLRALGELEGEEGRGFGVGVWRKGGFGGLVLGEARRLVEGLKNGNGGVKLTEAEGKIVWDVAGSLIGVVLFLVADAGGDDDIAGELSGMEPVIELLFAAMETMGNEGIAYDDGAPVSVRLDASMCLMTLLEDNEELARMIVSGEEGDRRVGLLSRSVMEGKDTGGDGGGRVFLVMSCGVFYNLSSSLGRTSLGDVSHADVIRSLVPALKDVQNEEVALPRENQWANHWEVVRLALEILASIGTALPLTIGKAGYGKDGEEEWGGIEDDDDDDEDGEEGKMAKEDEDMQEDEEMADSGVGAGQNGEDIEEEEEEDDDDDIADIQADMEMVTGMDDDEDEDEPGSQSSGLSTLNALVKTGIPAIISLFTRNLLLLDVPSSHHINHTELYRTRPAALAALNNIAWSVSCFDFSRDENQAILAAWEPAGRAIWEEVVRPVLAANTADVELAAAITGLAWAVARTLPGGRVPLGGDEHKKFMALYHAASGLRRQDGGESNEVSAGAGGKGGGKKQNEGANALLSDEEDPFQSLGVKCIGVLGRLALHPAPIPLNHEIGTFLINLLPESPSSGTGLSEKKMKQSTPSTTTTTEDSQPLAELIEILNLLFEIYGDEDYPYDEPVFWQGCFLERMESAGSELKRLAKGVDKRRFWELRTRADEAGLNLGRFVGYKRRNRGGARGGREGGGKGRRNKGRGRGDDEVEEMEE